MAIQEWKDFDALAFAKVFGIFGVIMGFLMGLLFAMGASVAIGPLGAGFGVASIIVFPLIYGIMGFACGAIFALIYNFIAKKIGGIKVTI